MYRWFIAYKYIASRQITLVALKAVTFSVMVLIVVVSIMEGFRTRLEERIRGHSSDIKIESDVFLGLKNPEKVQEALLSIPGINATAPVVETFALRSPRGVFGRQQETVDQVLLAMDLENDMAKRELEQSLRGIAESFDTDRLTDAREQAAMRTLVESQPTTIEGLFSADWIERDLWKPLEPFNFRPPARQLKPLVLGIEFFRNELLHPGRRVTLTSFSPDVREPLEETFLIVGFFKTGLYEFDAKGMILRMEDAEDFLHLRDDDGNLSVSAIRIDADEEHAGVEPLIALRERVEETLRESGILFVKTQTWRETKETLLDAVKVEKVIVSIMLGAVILFAGFMIFIILTVQVVEKTRDIAVMQSLGATTRGVASIYCAIGTSLCAVGMILGTAYGVAVGFCVNTILRWVKLLTGMEIFPDDVYYLDRIPVKFRPDDLILIIALTVAVSLISSILPAIRVARRNPTDGLRHG